MHAFTKGKKYNWLQRLLTSLAVLCAFLIMAVPARAASTVDFTQKGSLTITEGDGALSQKYSGIVIRIYKVASFDTESPAVCFVLTNAFAGSNIAVNGLTLASQQRDAAGKLADYIQSGAIPSTASVTTGTDGKAVFSGLELGLYLVTASASPGSGKTVSSSPFLVSIPFSDSGGWNYSVTAQPKCTVKDTPPTPPPTGQETLIPYVLFCTVVFPLVLGLLVALKRRLAFDKK